jgi:hypothetical protein
MRQADSNAGSCSWVPVAGLRTKERNATDGVAMRVKNDHSIQSIPVPFPGGSPSTAVRTRQDVTRCAARVDSKERAVRP